VEFIVLMKQHNIVALLLSILL